MTLMFGVKCTMEPLVALDVPAVYHASNAQTSPCYTNLDCHRSSLALPCINVVALLGKYQSRRTHRTNFTYLREIGRDDSSICELTSCQCLQCLARGIWCVKFDENLADTIGLSAPTAWPWDLHVKNWAIFGTFFFDVLEDF